MNRRTTVTVPCTIRTDVAVTVELSEPAIAAIKANAAYYDAPAIMDAKLGPNAGVTINDVRANMLLEGANVMDRAALDVAIVNAVRNGQLG